jgi:hypothetical protein
MSEGKDLQVVDLRIRSLILLVGVVCLAGPSRAQTYTTVWDNGPSDNRVDIVIIGDGYTEGQIETTYASHVQGMLDYMFYGSQDPFPRYRNYFNVHRVEVISAEEGADVPWLGIEVDTVLDAEYDANIQRYLKANKYEAGRQIGAALEGTGIEPDMRLISVNSSIYGGSGGSYAIFAGGNRSANELAMHELGHSYGDLADEYDYKHYTYTGSEPIEPNITTYEDGRKWAAWMGEDTGDGLGVIGTYEGGDARYGEGIWRSTSTSKMKELNRPFNAVSREAFVHRIYGDVDPLDGWIGKGSGLADVVALSDPGDLWVDPVDEQVVSIDWLVEGQSVDEHETTLDLFAMGYGIGTWEVAAIVEDRTSFVRQEQNLLRQDVYFDVTLTRAAGDADGDNDVDFADLTHLRRSYGSLVDSGTGADFNADGIVDELDLGILKKYFGMEYRWGTDFAPMVPEPTALVMMAVGALGLTRRRR